MVYVVSGSTCNASKFVVVVLRMFQCCDVVVVVDVEGAEDAGKAGLGNTCAVGRLSLRGAP